MSIQREALDNVRDAIREYLAVAAELICGAGHIAETDARAREVLWPAYEVMRNRIGPERGWGPTSRAEFDREIAEGSLYVGSPETVARKIAATVRALGASRFDLKYSAGTLAHERLLRSIELYGRE